MTHKNRRIDNTLTKESIIDIIELIIGNVEKKGLERFDIRDIRALAVLQNRSLLRKIILLIEEICPITLRKLLGIKKTIFPTTYYFIGYAYLILEKQGIKTKKKIKSIDLMNECISKYVTEENGEIWWNYEENKHDFCDLMKKDKRPTMYLYAISRCNQLINKLGNFYNNKEYIELSKKTLLKTLKYHDVIDIDREKKSICYFYNSIDSVINVNTEGVEWISMFKNNSRDVEAIKRAIINMVLDEQNDDGSWYYYSQYHKNLYPEGGDGDIDCHHSATVLYNLIHLLNNDGINTFRREDIIRAVNNGMKFFIDNFFDINTGTARTIIGYKRPAGPVQYSEAIIAFCDFLLSEIPFDSLLIESVTELLPKVISVLIQLVNQKNGSVPSQKVIFWLNLDSINWGNGPVLLALCKYLLVYDLINQED